LPALVVDVEAKLLRLLAPPRHPLALGNEDLVHSPRLGLRTGRKLPAGIRHDLRPTLLKVGQLVHVAKCGRE